MEIKITTRHFLKVLELVSWVIFIGLCIEAGGTIINTVIAFFINSTWTGNFWEGADYLTSLFEFDKGHFLAVAIIMIIVSVLKAILFYLIVKLFIEKKLSISQPFSVRLRRFVATAAYLALGIGMFSYYGDKYAAWLSKQGVPAVDLQALHIAGADVWLFMAVVLFVILQLVKRGIEIQSENDLTI
ncbi:MAG TPA: DUF2975 domain-containing protein [Flavisolibacter sp.]|nr:DUF2975 domain-containing protein [Flavisolibacter sp.]